VILAITLIPAVRATLTQQGQISDLRERLARQHETVAALQHEQRQWNDPAYVEQQARERLKFVRVGEKSYTVIDGLAPPDLAGGPMIAAPSKVATANAPWYGKLWQSMVIADNPASVPASNQPLPVSPLPVTEPDD
jgi:cell division protein FtsL